MDDGNLSQKPCTKCGTTKPADLKHFAQGSAPGRFSSWCRDCYNARHKARRAGVPRAPQASLSDRFWSQVSKDGQEPAHVPGIGPCWTWNGSKSSQGYGAILHQGRNVRAHRASFFLEHGRWPEPCCLHRCDNRACVRPSHLFEGTVADNNNDKTAKGRGAYGVSLGRDNGRCKYSDDEIGAIRSAHQRGEPMKAISRRTGVNLWYVKRIVRGLSRAG